MMNYSYLAGVIDSDGSLTISMLHKSRPNPVVRAIFQLTWVKTEETVKFIEELVSHYGGSFLFKQKKGHLFLTVNLP